MTEAKFCKEYLDKSIAEVKAMIAGIDKATVIKTMEMDRRLAELNELRRDVVQDRSMFVKKETYDVENKVIDDWMTSVNEKLTKLMVKYESRVTLTTLISLGSLLVSIITLGILAMHYFR